MARHKIISLKQSVGGIIQIGAELAFTWMKEEEGVLIDVREQEELEVEWIPGVTAMPLSLFNPNAIEGIGANKLIFICLNNCFCFMNIYIYTSYRFKKISFG